jgi:hypothetical protein
MDKIKDCDITESGICENIEYINNDWLCLECGEKVEPPKKDTNSTQSFTDWVLDFQEQHQELLSENNYEDIILEKAVDNFDK